MLIAFLGPSDNALSQSHECNFHAVILNLLLDGLISHKFLPLEYYLPPLHVTTIIQGLVESGKK